MRAAIPRIKESLRVALQRMVFERALPRWSYPLMHRVGPLRRALDLQAGAGPCTRRFLDELRREPVSEPLELLELDSVEGIEFGRRPLAVRQACIAPNLDWTGLMEVLSGQRILSWQGDDDGSFDAWYESAIKLESRPIPPALARLFDWSACSFLDGFCPTVWSQVEGNYSQLHQDFCSAVEMNVTGCKRWLLFPPSQEQAIYAHLLKSRGYRVGLVDPTSESSTRRFPDFVHSDGCIETMTRPGDLLYVPAGWFHHVQYLERSFSVHFFSLEEEIRNSDASPLFGLPQLRVIRGGRLQTINSEHVGG